MSKNNKNNDFSINNFIYKKSLNCDTMYDDEKEAIKSIADDYKDGVILFHYSSFNSDEVEVEMEMVHPPNKGISFHYIYTINYKDKKKVDEFLEDHEVRGINTYQFSIEVEKWINDNFMSLREFEKMVYSWHDKKTLKKNINNDKKRKKRII